MFPPMKRPGKPEIDLGDGADAGEDDGHASLKDEILAELVEKLQDTLDSKLRSKKPAAPEALEIEIDAEDPKRGLPRFGAKDDEDDEDYC